MLCGSRKEGAASVALGSDPERGKGKRKKSTPLRQDRHEKP